MASVVIRRADQDRGFWRFCRSSAALHLRRRCLRRQTPRRRARFLPCVRHCSLRNQDTKNTEGVSGRATRHDVFLVFFKSSSCVPRARSCGGRFEDGDCSPVALTTHSTKKSQTKVLIRLQSRCGLGVFLPCWRCLQARRVSRSSSLQKRLSQLSSSSTESQSFWP